MKCARAKCQRQPQPDRLYCSRGCAQADKLEQASSTPLTKTAPSITKAVGESLEAYSSEGWHSGFGKQSDIETQSSPNENVSSEETTMSSTSNESEPGSEKSIGESQTRSEESGVSDELKTLPQTLNEKKSDGNGNQEETRLMDFIAPLPTSGGGESVSTNLIDSCLLGLHDLMKDVAKENPRLRTSPQSVNAVCNIAKNMRELMVLKLNVVKTARKLEGK